MLSVIQGPGLCSVGNGSMGSIKKLVDTAMVNWSGSHTCVWCLVPAYCLTTGRDAQCLTDYFAIYCTNEGTISILLSPVFISKSTRSLSIKHCKIFFCVVYFLILTLPWNYPCQYDPMHVPYDPLLTCRSSQDPQLFVVLCHSKAKRETDMFD